MMGIWHSGGGSMGRRQFTVALWTLFLPGVARPIPLEAEAAAGVRAALLRGADAAVGLLGRMDGFWGNPQVRIGLPKGLTDAARLLKATGQGRQVDELVLAMNRAAEAAVPQARPLLLHAVKTISVEDAASLVKGGDTALTQFFAAKTRQPLHDAFLPIVTQSTEKLSLASRYNALAGRAAAMGLLKGDDTSVQRHVTARALDGLFLMIGAEERKLRADPLRAGSALLGRVFGGRTR